MVFTQWNQFNEIENVYLCQTHEKKKICHHYDNVTLEKMLEKHSNNKYTLQGIEALIDDDVQCQRMVNIKQGIKAVLNEQQKSNNKKRIWRIRRNKCNTNDDQKINAIANCYTESGNTIQCRQEAHSRGIEYNNSIMIVSPTTILFPPEVVQTKMLEI